MTSESPPFTARSSSTRTNAGTLKADQAVDRLMGVSGGSPMAQVRVEPHEVAEQWAQVLERSALAISVRRWMPSLRNAALR